MSRKKKRGASNEEGSKEIRQFWVVSGVEPKLVGLLTRFPGLRQIAYLRHIWYVGEKRHEEGRFFVTSLPRNRLSARRFFQLVRSHWEVENSLHHVMDVSWCEDHLRYKAPLGRALGQLRSLSLNAIRCLKGSKRAKTLPQKAYELLSAPLTTLKALAKL